MSKTLTAIADASIQEVDMCLNVSKTYLQHVHKRFDINVTVAEVPAIEKGYRFKCDFCSRRFRTERNMLIHRSNCKYGYNTTEEYYELEDITRVFGSKESRWFEIKWTGYPEPEWERENLLLRDGCQDEIRDFWSRTGLQPSKEYYPTPDGSHKCTVCGRAYKGTGP